MKFNIIYFQSQAAQAATVALQPGLQPQQIAQLQGQAITLQQCK